MHSMGVTSREKVELASYQLSEVDQFQYTQFKDNRLVQSGSIKLEEFKENFLGKYFPRKRREVMVEQFINLNHMSNRRDDMTRFMTSVTDLVKGECRMAMIYADMIFLDSQCMINPYKSVSLVGSLKT